MGEEAYRWVVPYNHGPFKAYIAVSSQMQVTLDPFDGVMTYPQTLKDCGGIPRNERASGSNLIDVHGSLKNVMKTMPGTSQALDGRT